MLSNVINSKLDEVLEMRGRTLYWLHKQTGISYNTLNRIEKNRVKGITFDVLEKICEKLDCTPNDLLSIEKSH